MFISLILLGALQSQPDLFISTKTIANPDIGSKHRNIQERTVDIDWEVLKNSPSSITLNLFNDLNLTANFVSMGPSANGGFLWRGAIEGYVDSKVLITFRESTAMGTIRFADQTVQLEYAGNGVHRVLLADHSQWPCCGTGLSHTIATEADEQVGIQAGNPEITVMVIYTTEAKSSVGSTAAMENKIDLAVVETNDSFADSGLSHRIELVYAEEAIGYVEDPTFFGILDDVTVNGDGELDWVHEVRDQLAADMVAVLCDNYQYCGLAWLMTNVGQGMADYAFSVTNESCATGGDVFAHELGHNMGSNHDRNNASSGAYSYSFGYRTPNNAYKTVMAYYPGAVTGRWSGPNVTYNGVTMGTSTEDNVRSLVNTGSTVSNWRSGPAVPPAGDFELSIPSLVAGGSVIIQVSGVTPSSPIYIGYSLTGAGPSQLPIGTVQLSQPISRLASLTSTSSGTASYAASVPASASGISVWLQAYDQGAGNFSSGVYKYIF